MKIKNLHIKEFKGLRDISINFEKNDKPLDLVVLAGSNGSGKTRVLESILKYFQDHLSYKQNNIEAGIFYEEKEKNCISNVRDFFYRLESFSYCEANDPLREKHIEIKNKLDILPKVIYVPTEINFQKMNTASTTLVQEYKFINIVNTNLIKDIPSYIATKMISAMLKNKNEKVGDVQKKVFNEINEIFENLSIDVKVEDISQDGRNITLFTNSSGNKFDINELSSGEKQLFLRTLAIRMLNPENSIILIDEPELSLHPKWQQRIVDVYTKIGKNNQIIIATHSPHILGSVRKENIMLLDKDDEGKIVVRTGDELYDSYGQPTDRVLKDIMGLQTTRNPKVFKLLEEVRKIVDRDEYNSDEFKEKYRELKGILGSKDEDIFLIDMDIKIRKKRGLKNAESK
ncbi:DNA replication and repair protein RecF [uncultured Leptotrichia sp.]|uniref:AAA family ATPase n=1 Tax=uncultured Leptotrichia sp. TaxID=159271 RepID=UPI001A3A4511|nr:ATP-binding protein [uncultured Leptotrichia sp.]VTX58524.1 DNA replication and repair protein RecF [uncultured Leptotrichia sp.]